MSAPGVVLIKNFTYRGSDEEWSNSYHLAMDDPGDGFAWRDLVDALVDMEKECYTSAVTIVRALCYRDLAPHQDSVYTYHLADFAGEVSGVLDTSIGAIACPGDDACTVGWDTGARNSQGKPIWLRKYFHDVYRDGGSPDVVDANQQTALGVYAGAVVTPADPWPGLANPNGDIPAGAPRVSSFITTRTLKRRGKRPS